METLENIGTVVVWFTFTDGTRTFLTFDYEGGEKFAAFSHFHEAVEFGSRAEAEEAVRLAKFQGLKFEGYTIL